MWKTLWARITGAPAKPQEVPPAPQLSRAEQLREDRVRKAMERGMAALESRPAGMTDKDRLIFGRQVVSMLAASLG